MSAEDWMPDYFDSYDEEDAYCKFCDCDGLHWEETATGWRLFDDEGSLHDCRNEPAGADEFEDLTNGD